ncbi:hypothetical protein EJB05_01438, partial [Eragrostis curvula]
MAAQVSGARIDVGQTLEERDWAGLVPELVSKIADHLLADDVREYIRIRAVCKLWRSSTIDPSLLEPRFFPRNWLLIAGEHLRSDDKPERFVNVRTGASIRIRLPDPHLHTHHGNAEGLLLLHHNFTDKIYLLNPLTMAFTCLPTMLIIHEVARPRGEFPNNMYNTDSIKAAGIVVNVNKQGRARSLPTVVLSLTTGTDTAIVYTEPGDHVWRAVNMSCTFDVKGKQPAIQGGLSVRGRFYVPTRTGNVLTVELQPQPRLRYVAKMTVDPIHRSFNGSSYLVPSCDDTDCGMLLVRPRRPHGRLGCKTFAVDLRNGSLSQQDPSRVTIFLPSVTLLSSVFPSVVENTIYSRGQMIRLLQGDYI